MSRLDDIKQFQTFAEYRGLDLSEISGATPEDQLERIPIDALAWVNEHREKRGLPTLAQLPLGRRGWATQCPIANAISDDRYAGFASSGGYTLSPREDDPNDERSINGTFSTSVAAFITAFDIGLLTQFEIPDDEAD